MSRSMIFSISKMLLGKTKKDYFGWKVKCIYCIYVLLYINSDEEWQGSYENPGEPARYNDNDAWKYWSFLLYSFLSGSKQWRKVVRVMREYCKPFHYTKEDRRIGIWRISSLQRKFSQLASSEITCYIYL